MHNLIPVINIVENGQSRRRFDKQKRDCNAQLNENQIAKLLTVKLFLLISILLKYGF